MEKTKKPYNEEAVKWGAQLAEARKKLGLTQSETAMKLGISTNYYCHLEQGCCSLGRANGAVRLNIKKLLKVSL